MIMLITLGSDIRQRDYYLTHSRPSAPKRPDNQGGQLRGAQNENVGPLRIPAAKWAYYRSHRQRSISVGSNRTNRPIRMCGMRPSRAIVTTVLRATQSNSATSSGVSNDAVRFSLGISSLLTPGDFDVPPVRTRPWLHTPPRRARNGRRLLIRRFALQTFV